MSKRRSTAERKRIFLDGVTRGSSVSEAAGHAGVARSTVYSWRERDLQFVKDWGAAEEVLVGDLERKAYELAKDGNVRMLIWLLERHDRAEAHGGDEEDEGVVGVVEVIGLEDGGDGDGFITFVDS
jgi:transposase-like protein